MCRQGSKARTPQTAWACTSPNPSATCGPVPCPTCVRARDALAAQYAGQKETHPSVRGAAGRSASLSACGGPPLAAACAPPRKNACACARARAARALYVRAPRHRVTQVSRRRGNFTNFGHGNQFRSILANGGAISCSSVRCRPMLCDFGQRRATSTNFGRLRPVSSGFGQSWASSANVANHGSSVNFANCGRCRPTLGDFAQKRADAFLSQGV